MSGSPSLISRSVRASSWAGAAILFQQLFQFLTRVVLARLFEPADFGLVGMASVLISALVVFQTLGLAAALVHRRDRVEDAAATAFWLLLAGGTLLTVGAYLMAVPMGRFFNAPEVVPLARVLSFSMVIGSVSWVSGALLSRELAYHRTFRAEVAAAVTYGAVSIGLALLGMGAISLAWGFLASGTVRTVSLLILAPFRLRRYFDTALAKELLRYGASAMSVGMVNYILPQVDITVVGRFMGSTALGYYTMALQVVNMVGTYVIMLVRRVAFPAMAEIQNDPVQVRRAYDGVLHLMAAIILPGLVGVAVAGRWLIPAVFGDQWHASVPLTAALVPLGFAVAAKSIFGVVLLAVGKPRVYEKMAWGELALLTVLLLASARTGDVRWVAVAVSTSNLISMGFYAEFVCRTLEWKRRGIFATAARPAVSAAIMGIVLVPLHLWNPAPLIGSLVSVPMGAGCYLAVMWRIDSREVRKIWGFIRNRNREN